ncbi:hypothetical protein FUAX_54780 (plasmid) [Fulvitalea axinellae]|uniref:Uncharacterized protein n=1 Tax=Fulvitalea axinellae TaxID=1182444 RepID=A0AAU9DIS0_9BACT|nr:hypothetical protein FUAX_54780 [Fulvitalea axinellae]
MNTQVSTSAQIHRIVDLTPATISGLQLSEGDILISQGFHNFGDCHEVTFKVSPKPLNGSDTEPGDIDLVGNDTLYLKLVHKGTKWASWFGGMNTPKSIDDLPDYMGEGPFFNDSPVLKKAISSLKEGETLFIDSGTWYIGEPVTCDNLPDNISIIGEGNCKITNNEVYGRQLSYNSGDKTSFLNLAGVHETTGSVNLDLTSNYDVNKQSLINHITGWYHITAPAEGDSCYTIGGTKFVCGNQDTAEQGVEDAHNAGKGVQIYINSKLEVPAQDPALPDWAIEKINGVGSHPRDYNGYTIRVKQAKDGEDGILSQINNGANILVFSDPGKSEHPFRTPGARDKQLFNYNMRINS